MVVASSLTNEYHQTRVGSGYDGVVRVVVEDFYGTGVLLYSGMAILTAAHVMENDAGDIISNVTIEVETASGLKRYTSDQVLIHPDYDTENSNFDLALIKLPELVEPAAERYSLYRGDSEIGSETVLVGYGSSGTGARGSNPYSDIIRYKAQNQFDMLGGSFSAAYGSELGWIPDEDGILVADFDNGYRLNDALGHIGGVWDSGTGSYEGIIAPGDSGGPAFIDGQVAGIASYISSFNINRQSPDIDYKLNSSFGEVAFWQRISTEQQWIDQTVRSFYADAPQTPEEVITRIIEGDSGSTYTYFLLQFTGIRSSADEVLSVDYTTRNGSARAGEDYLAVNGTLNLYPGEDQAVIPVEILGDVIPEGDETFYLDIFNPVGGSFGGGIDVLSAMRTILDDDWA
ncbi:MAG: trypsin-like serine protease [Desulfuromonadaceae bacterium]|nr:trypsin-like serine protease [Desulfuromonadaceae bacterium]